jgi:hypothetical protein
MGMHDGVYPLGQRPYLIGTTTGACGDFFAGDGAGPHLGGLITGPELDRSVLCPTMLLLLRHFGLCL